MEYPITLGRLSESECQDAAARGCCIFDLTFTNPETGTVVGVRAVIPVKDVQAMSLDNLMDRYVRPAFAAAKNQFLAERHEG